MKIEKIRTFLYGQFVPTGNIEKYFFGFFSRPETRYITKEELEAQVKQFIDESKNIEILSIVDRCRIEEDWNPDLGSFIDRCGGITVSYIEHI